MNEMADQAAKLEAQRKVKVDKPLERKIVLTLLKEEVKTNWQRRVNNDLGNHQVAEINNQVSTWKLHNINGIKHLIRLITGHHFLNSFQSHIRPNMISKYCTCGQTETLHHFLFTCQRFTRFRQKWLMKIYHVTGDLDVFQWATYKTVFGQREDLTDNENRKLQESTCEYILNTNRFC